MGEYFDPLASFDGKYKVGFVEVRSDELRMADSDRKEKTEEISLPEESLKPEEDGLNGQMHQSNPESGSGAADEKLPEDKDTPVTETIRMEKSPRKHHRSHHHRKGPLRRFRHWYRKHSMMICVVFLLFLAAAAAGGYVVYKRTSQQKRQHVSSSNSHDMGSGYRVINYEGKKYRYNNLITTFLYTGIDSSGPMRTYSIAGEGPLADTIDLVVLDKKNKRMSVISINRYTLTRILRYSAFFNDSEYYESMICYTFSFGDGAKLSCQNLTEAVSYLLGIPIDEYIVSNLDSMTYINDIVGGVTVTVPNDTLTDKIPGAVKGSKLEITSDNVMTYLRTRDITRYFTNDERLERQKSYILAYLDKLRSILPEERSQVWDKLEEMNQYMLTSVTKNKYLQYAKLLGTVDFSEENYYSLPGYNQRGMYYDEFVPDKEGIQKLVIDLFYEAA